MPRYTLDLPSGESVEYGLDLTEAAWFVDLLDESGKVVETFDSSSPGYDHERPVRSLLEFIGSISDLFDAEDAEEAVLSLVHMPVEALRGHLRIVGMVIENLRRAAEEGREE